MKSKYSLIDLRLAHPIRQWLKNALCDHAIHRFEMWASDKYDRISSNKLVVESDASFIGGNYMQAMFEVKVKFPQMPNTSIDDLVIGVRVYDEFSEYINNDAVTTTWKALPESIRSTDSYTECAIQVDFRVNLNKLHAKKWYEDESTRNDVLLNLVELTCASRAVIAKLNNTEESDLKETISKVKLLLNTFSEDNYRALRMIGIREQTLLDMQYKANAKMRKCGTFWE